MSDINVTPPLGYVPDPLTPHRVVIEFDVLARSQAEADYIVNEVLVEELAGEPETIRTDGDRVFGEDFGGDPLAERFSLRLIGAEDHIVQAALADTGHFL